MLTHLSIRDIVLIERLDIRFDRGLSVLTGETGAGKSILIDALSLALGSRGDASLVRQGAEQGQVTAVFDVPLGHAAREILKQNGVNDDGEIILRRLQARDGRSRSYINDQAVSVGFLRELGRMLVEIHGQHDERALTDIETHRALLDFFARLEPEVIAVQQSYENWQVKKRAARELFNLVNTNAREADYLLSAVEELDRLDPQPDEEARLSEKRSQMMKAERIARDIGEAHLFLSDADSPIPLLAGLVRRLERKTTDLPELITPIVKAVDEAIDALGRAQEDLEKVTEFLNFDPHELEKVEERLFALRGAARKYQTTVDELANLRGTLDAQLTQLKSSQKQLAELEGELVRAQADYDEKAQGLSQKRQAAAAELTAAVAHELPALKLERAEFIVNVDSDNERRHSDGIDSVEFCVRTNPNTRAGPILKVASGGELSRFLLALKVALADRGSAPTLIFDEIDVGVGGAVADAIGQRLARLAEKVQVLAITHAPQVAARAHAHFLIAKNQRDQCQTLATTIRQMDDRERTEELARMLSGSIITSEARAAAKTLINHDKSFVATVGKPVHNE